MPTRTAMSRSLSGPEPSTDRLVDYRALLGDAAWNRLPGAIRARFRHQHRREVTYVGRMERVALNRAGQLLAVLCLVLGEPLVAAQGRDVPAQVRVFQDGLGGTVWQRAYHFPGRPTRTVCSAKRLAGDGSLLECLGFGLHMQLAVHEHQGELHFRSTAYYWKLLGLRIPLPRRWFPGETHVVHRDEGDGRFRFQLRVHHPLFGELVHQDGLFQEQIDPFNE